MCLRKCNKPCDKFTLATCLDRIRTEKELKAYKNICECGHTTVAAIYRTKQIRLCTKCNPILREIRGIV